MQIAQLAHVFALAALLGIAFGATPAAQNAVRVVGPAAAPGVDFTSIQDAIDAAADGDTILVRPGTYAAFVCEGKGVYVVADRKLSPRIVATDSGSLVRDLPAGSAFVLRGFELDVSAGHNPPSVLRFEHCTGNVRLEYSKFLDYGVRIEVADCAGVSLSRTDNFVLQASDSNIAMHTCRVIAADATGTGQVGWPAAVLTNSTLEAQSTRFFGGKGGPAAADCSVPGGAGGVGLSLSDSSASLIAGRAMGGAGGTGGSGACAGPVGDPHAMLGGSALNSSIGDPPAWVHHLGHGVAREHENFALYVYCKPGDVALLAISPDLAHAPWPGIPGTLLLDLGSASVHALGMLSTGIQVAMLVPELGPSIAARHFVAQAVFLKPGGLQLGSSASFTWLDSAY